MLNQEIHDFQQRFGKSIRTPLHIDEQGGHTQAEYYDHKSLQEISPQEQLGMTAADRLGVYNQQYWFRLISVFQEEYPLTLRFLGLDRFNALVMDHLSAHPSSSPLLQNLSDRWLTWLKDNGADRDLLEVAQLDRIYIELFDAPQAQSTVLEADNIQLSPCLRLYTEHRSWLETRQKLQSLDELNPPEHQQAWALFRDPQFRVRTHPLHPCAYSILKLLDQHGSIETAMEHFAKNLSEEKTEGFNEEDISVWFAHWHSQAWIISPS